MQDWDQWQAPASMTTDVPVPLKALELSAISSEGELVAS
jgi:hypothetical protein